MKLCHPEWEDTKHKISFTLVVLSVHTWILYLCLFTLLLTERRENVKHQYSHSNDGLCLLWTDRDASGSQTECKNVCFMSLDSNCKLISLVITDFSCSSCTYALLHVLLDIKTLTSRFCFLEADILVYINDTCVLGRSHKEVVEMLKSVPMGQSVDVVLRRGYPMLYNPDGCPKQSLETVQP